MAPEKSVLPVNAVVVVEPPLPASLAKPVQQDVNTASVNSSTDAVNAQHIPANNADHDELEEAPLLVLVTTYVSFIILIVFGHLRDFIGKRLKPSSYNHLKVADVSRIVGVNKRAVKSECILHRLSLLPSGLRAIDV